jgi:tetratricopeptide (TPR) repeat protein
MPEKEGSPGGSRDANREARERERLDRAIDAMTQASKDLSGLPGSEHKDIIKSGQRNLALAHLRRGRLRLLEAESQINKGGVSAGSTKQAEDALSDLQRAVELGTLESQNHERGNAECMAALAAAQAGQYKTAREQAARAKESGCELVSPYSKFGTELLLAFITYRSSNTAAQREQLLKTLSKLQSRAGGSSDSGPVQKLLRALLFSTYLALAYDYHLSGRNKLVGPALRNAQKFQVRTGEDDDAILAHNLAVADVLEGRSGGERVFERLGSRPPEALVNLGILYDRRGEIRRALELYRKALERGARTSRLREWIDTKDRLLGQAQ